MPEPALKIATDYVHVAWASFTLVLMRGVNEQLVCLGLTLTDLTNAVRGCKATWSDKQEASNALFEVTGETTEGVLLTILVRVVPDCRRFIIEEVF